MPADLNRARGEAIRAARLEHGFTQRELGDRSGIAPQQFSKFENGSHKLAAAQVWRIAQTLNVPVQEIFTAAYALARSAAVLPDRLHNPQSGAGAPATQSVFSPSTAQARTPAA